MQYLGGKSRLAKFLCAAITPVRRRLGPDGEPAPPRPFWDAFCGGLSISVELSRLGPGLVSDANPALIALYASVARGWDPPDALSEAEYAAARALPDSNPIKAFAGFGCSFGGKWFGGYARARDKADPCAQRGYAHSARVVLLRDVGLLAAASCQLARVDFLAVEPFETDHVLYLDPPYADTTGYGATGPFDHERFYARVASWSRITDVFVSEYDMPRGRPIMEFSHDMSVAGGVHKDARIEKLFHFHPGRPY